MSATTPFTEESLYKLHTLTQATPDPGPEVLDIWASLFHVSRPVLQYAIEVVLPSHFQTPTSPTCPPSPRSRRLPTPPRSSTPELPRDKWPRFSGSPESLKKEIHSPMIPNVVATGEPLAFHHQHNHPNIFVPSASLPASASVSPAMYKQPHLHVSHLSSLEFRLLVFPY